MQSKIITIKQLIDILNGIGLTDIVKYVDFHESQKVLADSVQVSTMPSNKKGFRIVDHELTESPNSYHRVSSLVGGVLAELKGHGAEIDSKHGYQYAYFNRYTKAEVCYRLKLTRIPTYVNTDYPHETSWLVAEKTG